MGTCEAARDATQPALGKAFTPRELEVCTRFGVLPETRTSRARWPREVDPAPGTITLVTGPSGAGKTLLLNALTRQRGGSRAVHNQAMPRDVAILDGIAPTRPIAEALELLTACSLGEPRLWLRRVEHLSEGERFRARLARAISLQQRTPAAPLICDEFGSGLHRRAAKAIAFNLRKLATRRGLAFVVGTAHEDLERDLQPDVILRVAPRGMVTIERPRRRALKRPTFARRLRVERGSLPDYAALAAMHYRQRDQIGYVDRVFLLRDVAAAETVGVIVLGHAPLELSLRNAATNGRFSKNPARLNRNMRIIRRLIIHPDIRGCGIGHWFVRQTLPRAGTPYVECLASMGLFNPVFERAGMERIGLCPVPVERERLVRALRAEGVDPLSADFARTIARRPRARRLVAEAVAAWYRASTGAGEDRAGRQSAAVLARTFRQLIGSRPVYYLWHRKAGHAAKGKRT